VLTESLIRTRFIDKLEVLVPGLTILEKSLEVELPWGRADLVFKGRIGDVEKYFVCEIKSSGEPKYLYQAISQVKLFSLAIKQSYPLIVVPHIRNKGKELCKLLDVGYVDLNGNCFIKFDNVLIQRDAASVSLKASVTVQHRKRVLSGLFAPLSSRIIRILLLNPDKSWTLKELSNTVNVSIGYAHKVAKSLEVKGYILKDANYRLKVNRPGRLLDEWATIYDFVRANIFHSFYTFERDLDTFINKLALASEREGLKYALTLHAGASKVAPYTRFTDIHFYVDVKDTQLWRETLDLRPVERGGTIFLVEPFDLGVFEGLQFVDRIKIVSDIQLYVDLYNYPARGREQAEYLKEKRIMFR